MPNEIPKAWHPLTLRFARTERLTVTATAELELLTHVPRSDLEVLASLRDAVTSWVKDTVTGQALWRYSSEDLNIGDLLGMDAFDDGDLLDRMDTHGLRVVTGSTSALERALAYDTVLVNAGHDLDFDEEPDEEHEVTEV